MIWSITFSSEERYFIAPTQTSNSPTFWTKCRRRNFNFFIERKIFRFCSEVFFAVLTLSDFVFHKITFLYMSNMLKPALDITLKFFSIHPLELPSAVYLRAKLLFFLLALADLLLQVYRLFL